MLKKFFLKQNESRRKYNVAFPVFFSLINSEDERNFLDKFENIHFRCEAQPSCTKISDMGSLKPGRAGEGYFLFGAESKEYPKP